ncbi:hypothetical protein ACFOGJ_04575 [Marinibaculum pumilum]|uniref:Uncharacterized protein n=1 Tax=Marinibaculum pumilum TaxID=1766165 RepID=A0ABV7KVV1_9PROT
MADQGPQRDDGKAGPDEGAESGSGISVQERAARLRGRNLLLGGALLLLVLLLYAVSFVKTPPGPGGPAEEQGAAAPAAQPLSGLRGN